MNCRIPRIIESLNASCARGLSKGISARASPRPPTGSQTRVKLAVPARHAASVLAGSAEIEGNSYRRGDIRPAIRCSHRVRQSAGLQVAPSASEFQSRSKIFPKSRLAPGLFGRNNGEIFLSPGSRRDSKKDSKSRIRPLIGKDHPLSLSISLSGGEETNQDFPSNGERTGKSPA